jgi:uncharacterized protein (TIGR03437 family)
MRRPCGIAILFALVFLLFPAAQAQQTGTETVTYTYNGNPIRIFPDDADVITLVNLFVPRALKITNVTVRVQASYSGVGDLNLYMYSAYATRAKLLERNCGSLLNIDTTFDDAAPSKYADVCPAQAGLGPFRGNEPLANYRDQGSLGIWTLAIENNGSNKAGWLTQFAVTITGTPVVAPTFVKQTVGNTASLSAGAIAPGEMVSIYGYALGPVTPVSAPAGNWPTYLAGTEVFFDGTPVPIAFTSNYLVQVQAPFQLTPGKPVNVQIKYNSATSAVVPIDVAVTAPGIFTVTSSGIGQAKVVNSDGTLNSVLNPALMGSYITAYVSGLGAVDPTMTAGQVPPPGTLFTTVQGVAASVGGMPAKVTWAGVAPGLIGVYQVNILLDQPLQAGTQTLVVSAAGNSSQKDVTVEIAAKK